MTEVANGGRLGRELEVAKKQVTDVDTRQESLEVGLGILFRDLQMEVGPVESIETAAMRISDQAQVLARAGLQRGVHKTNSIIHSHYPKLDYKTMSEGWAPGYEPEEIVNTENEMASVAQRLAATIEEEDTAEEEDTEEAHG